jgi:ABC-type uncharacterized transport system fused permease/ATPase subunit
MSQCSIVNNLSFHSLSVINYWRLLENEWASFLPCHTLSLTKVLFLVHVLCSQGQIYFEFAAGSIGSSIEVGCRIHICRIE